MDESNNTPVPTSVWLNFALNRQIPVKMRRELREHIADPHELALTLSGQPPKLQTPDASLNLAVQKALNTKLDTAAEAIRQRVLDWQNQSPEHHCVGLDHPAYPELLLQTANAPPLLYVRGNTHCLSSPCIAIVGARKASPNALAHAREIAHKLASCGITIVSGLALGTDGAAHRGTLQAGGSTVAVAATGMDRVYPKQHVGLADEIATNGAIITEFPVGSQLRPHCFPRRNRIISGLSLGVLVIEAALPSGTLTTAQHALRQGREVMAMPGSVNNPLARGCHELIRNGAALIENADDVLACLGLELSRHCLDRHPSEAAQNTKNLTSGDPDTITLLDYMGFDPATIDDLVLRSGLNTARVSAALTHLELSGVIVADSGGRYSRCKHTGSID